MNHALCVRWLPLSHVAKALDKQKTSRKVKCVFSKVSGLRHNHHIFYYSGGPNEVFLLVNWYQSLLLLKHYTLRTLFLMVQLGSLQLLFFILFCKTFYSKITSTY